MQKLASLTVAVVASLLYAHQGRASDLIVSMNDNHTVLDADGNQVAANPMRPDTADIIDVGQSPPRIVQTFDVPGSVVGPPFAVWVAQDVSWAIFTSATKPDPAVKFGIAPDDRVSVVDLSSKPPQIVQTLTSGAGATTVWISPDGKLALIANRTEGSISAFAVKDKRLVLVGKTEFGKQSGASGIAFSKDSKTALISRQFDHQVTVLHIDGTAIKVDPRPITTALGPYTMDVNGDQSLVAVSNMGRGNGDIDSVSLIDLTQSPPLAVSITAVASGPEPLKFSPDGKFLAVGAELGTPLATGDRFYHDHGLLQVFAVDGHKLTQVATGPIGRWVEGIAWSRDGKTILVQNDRDRTISVFNFDGHALMAMPDLLPTGGPVSFGVPWP